MNKKNDIFCNPLPLPDLPRGIACREKSQSNVYLSCRHTDYRELADPEMLYDNGKWYIFPSGHQAYVSSDMVNWEYCPIEIDGDLGYAPTIARCGNKYYLTASGLYRGNKSRMFAADSPLGPYKNLGEIRDIDGDILPTEYLDPSLFCDDDGRLYLYWGYAPDGGGIFAVELDANDPTKALAKPIKVIDFDGTNEFERFGEYAEYGDWGYVEGAAMFKHNGQYYLEYSGCGTVFRHYSLGVYRSDSPLGPFTVQRTPLLVSPWGIVNGTGHGGMVSGPDNTVWQFYTCLLRRSAVFERRLGMDKVEFDANGDAHVQATAVPQSLSSGSMNWVPVSVNKPVTVSSFRNDQYGSFANDDCTHTWFAPEKDDANPYWEVNLRKPFDINAFRILWVELDLSYKDNILAEPVRYKVEFFDADHKLLGGTFDNTSNTTDLAVDFRVIDEVKGAQIVRLSWLKGEKIDIGLNQFTLFAPPRPVK